MSDTLDPRASLDTAIDAARMAKPTIKTNDGRTFAFVPDEYLLKDLTDPLKLPDHIRQKLVVDDKPSFSSYISRFRDARSVIFADYDNGTVTGCLDWHCDNQVDLKPQQSSHLVKLELRKSEEFARWDEMEGALHAQDVFAMFIEENVSDLASPDHSTMLEICRDLEATQGARFKSGIRLDNGDRTFVYETETQVKNDFSVPTEISLLIPLYHGEEPVELKAKFRFRPTPDGLKLGFNWHRVEYQRQAIFRQVAFAASEETGCPLFFGRF